jgi:hypothetical protein
MFALLMLALLPRYVQTSPSTAIKLLQGAAVCIAFTSATVVNALTALASLQCEDSSVDEATGKVIEEHPELAKGKALGTFRSSGQLGRALGPLLGRICIIGFACPYSFCQLVPHTGHLGLRLHKMMVESPTSNLFLAGETLALRAFVTTLW